MQQTAEYIFSINTGRSGSHYLAQLFEHVRDCGSFHEPEPIGYGEIMRRYACGDTEAMRRFSAQKVEAIRALKADFPTYVETNHAFIKGFGWFLPEHIPQEKIGVVILRRDKHKIAESIRRIGASPLNGRGRMWITTPEIRSPIVAPPRRVLSPRATYNYARVANILIRRMSRLGRNAADEDVRYPKWMRDYELECLTWYVEEIFAKADAYKRQFPGIRFFEAEVDDMNSIDTVRRMLALFGLREKASLQDAVGTPTNLKLTA